MIGQLSSLLALTLLGMPSAPPAPSSESSGKLPASLEGVRIEQRLDAQVPGELTFLDEQGHEVQLKRFFGDKPIILTLVYFRCPMLCTQVLNGMVHALQGMPGFEIGDQFQVVTVSFDPKDDVDVAVQKKANYVKSLGSPHAAEGWHFLTGQEDQIQRLTDSVGFFYKYDTSSNQYSHASALMVLTPEGRVARYFYGITFRPRDLRLGLVEASNGKIGTPVDSVLMYCFHYDPASGKYNVAVMNLVRVGGAAMLLALGAFFMTAWWSGRKKAARGSSAIDDSPSNQASGST